MKRTQRVSVRCNVTEIVNVTRGARCVWSSRATYMLNEIDGTRAILANYVSVSVGLDCRIIEQPP